MIQGNVLVAAQVVHGEMNWQEHAWMDAIIINLQIIQLICVLINVHKILIFMVNSQQILVYWVVNQDFIHIQLKECVFQDVMHHIMLTHRVNFVF